MNLESELEDIYSDLVKLGYDVSLEGDVRDLDLFVDTYCNEIGKLVIEFRRKWGKGGSILEYTHKADVLALRRMMANVEKFSGAIKHKLDVHLKETERREVVKPEVREGLLGKARNMLRRVINTGEVA